MTADALVTMHGTRVLVCAPDGPKVNGEGDALDVIGDAFGQEADLVLIPAERLAADFFTLRTRVAGEIVQKFVNYRLRLAIVGDISRQVAASPALRDFVAESNRGTQLWFVATPDDLGERLRDGRRQPT